MSQQEKHNKRDKNHTFVDNNNSDNYENTLEKQEHRVCPTCQQIPFAGNMIRIGSGFTICPTCADFMLVFS